MDSIKLRLLKLQQLAYMGLFSVPVFVWFIVSMYLLVQAVFGEIFNWLEYGKWLGRDLYWFFGVREGTRLSDWVGVNQILSSLMSMHSIIGWFVFSVLCLVLFFAFIAVDEKVGTTASLDRRIKELESKLQQARAVKAEEYRPTPFWSFSGLAQDLGRIWAVIYVVIVGGFVMILALTAIAVFLGY